MVKVEMEDNEETGITAFIFTASSEDELKVIDKLRVAFLGDHPKIGSFVESDKLVIKTKIPVEYL